MLSTHWIKTLLPTTPEWLSTTGQRSQLGEAAVPPPMSAERSAAMARAQLDFLQAAEDLSSPRGADLRERIRSAGSLRDLWHLRAEVFMRVSLQHNQALALARLEALNVHFPHQATGMGQPAPAPGPGRPQAETAMKSAP